MKVPPSEEAAQAFAQRFVACCNRGDIEAVLGHFAEDCTFDSPLAEKYVGTTRLAGKAALRAYWQKASAEIKDVHFDVDLVAVPWPRVSEPCSSSIGCGSAATSSTSAIG